MLYLSWLRVVVRPEAKPRTVKPPSAMINIA